MERARVELRTDPKGLGRVKVRIPGIHGESASVDSLPWAFILSQGGGFDSGDFKPPEVGSWVLVEKSDIEEQYYILGVIRGTGNTSTRGSFIDETDERYDKQLIGKWETDGKPEVPAESQNTGEPATVTVYKTLKGATIKISDVDGDENIEIIGHDGSTIKMISPKKPEYYKGRENTRLDRNMNNPIPKDQLETTAIIMKDSSGNIIRSMGNRDGKSTIEIVGAGSNGFTGVEILPDDNRMTMFCKVDDKRSEIDITSNSVEMTTGQSSLSLVDGTISINCSNLIIKSDSITQSGNTIELKSDSTSIGGNSVSISSSNASLTGDSVQIGGGGVSIGPNVALGSSISKNSVPSPDGKVVKEVGDWTNNIDKKYGGIAN